MTHIPVELSNVIYNPATQAFEGRAVVHDPEGARSYACAVYSPITTDYSRAAERLTAQALRRHEGKRPRSIMPQAKIGRAAPKTTPAGQYAMSRLRQLLAAA